MMISTLAFSKTKSTIFVFFAPLNIEIKWLSKGVQSTFIFKNLLLTVIKLENQKITSCKTNKLHHVLSYDLITFNNPWNYFIYLDSCFLVRCDIWMFSLLVIRTWKYLHGLIWTRSKFIWIRILYHFYLNSRKILSQL